MVSRTFWCAACMVLVPFSFISSPPAQNVSPAAAAPTSGQALGFVSILDLGGKGDGATDNTTSFNAAIKSASGKSLTVYFPCGVYRFASRPNPIGAGIRLRGCG